MNKQIIRMKTFLTHSCLTFLFLLPCFITAAQCPVGDVALTTQAEVDAFGNNYPNCNEITGNLAIGYFSGSATSDIADLSP